MLGALLFAAPALADPPAGFVARQGDQLTLDGQPYRSSGFNLYYANSDGTCGPAFGSGPALDQALSMMGSGVNTIRAWFFQSMATTAAQRDWSAFDHTLSVAAAHGMKVIPTLANQWADCEPASGYKDETWYRTGYTSPDPGGTVSYRDFVAEVVNRYKDDPTILAWQLMNEAEVKPSMQGACSPDAATVLRSFATDVSGLVKSIDPNHLVSLGTIGGGQCGAQGQDYETLHAIPTIDLCEFHDYDPSAPIPGDQFNGLQVRINQCAALDKPLFVGELGIIPNDVGGTLQARADVLEQKLAAERAAGIEGTLVWSWSSLGSTLDNYDVGPDDPVLTILQGPTISVASPLDGGRYQLHQSVSAGYACTEGAGGSGVATCVGDVPDGGAIDTSTVGPHTLTVVSSDLAENQAGPVIVPYTVEYRPLGFFSPAPNSKWKRGKTVSVEMALAASSGVRISDAAARSLASACAVHLSASGGQSKTSTCMKYDAKKNQFVLSWKLAKQGSGPTTISATVTYPTMPITTVLSEGITIT
jgi:mannan endo-1,4-beta-mannosidase